MSLLRLSFSVLLLCAFTFLTTRAKTTDRPIVGILAGPTNEQFPDLGVSFASVVEGRHTHFVEGGGARLLPLSYKNVSAGQLWATMKRLNGLFFPDSVSSLVKEQGELTEYARIARLALEFAKRLNSEGVYFPVWGSGAGFELLMLLESGDLRLLAECKSCSNYNTRLLYTTNATAATNARSTMFGSMPAESLSAMGNSELAHYNHKLMLRNSDFAANSNLATNYRLLAQSRTPSGDLIVAAIEHVRYPIYAVQFDPGAWLYDWNQHQQVVRTMETMFLGHGFANFFVAECKRNDQGFSDYREELENIVESRYHMYHQNYGYLYLLD